MTDLIVALDGPFENLSPLIRSFGNTVQWLKVDPAFFLNDNAVSVVGELKEAGYRLFFDLKLYGTTISIARAADRARRLGANMLTVYADEWMIGAAQSGGDGEVQVIACGPLSDQYLDTTKIVPMSSAALKVADGLVCPPRQRLIDEAATLPHFPKVIVVPGIRPPGFSNGGHARTLSPCLAAAMGATHLVVGGPIYEDTEPERIVVGINEQIRRGEFILAQRRNP